MVMFGELDLDTEDLHLKDFERIDYRIAKAQLDKHNLEKIQKAKGISKTYLTKGLTSDFSKADLY